MTAAKETLTQQITVIGQGPKGEIFKKHGRWHWRRNSGACEAFPRSYTALDVAEHVAHLCRADGRWELTS